MNGETTNVVPRKNSEVKVCAAKVVPDKKEFILGNGTVINIREHLSEYPTTKISLVLGKEEIKKGAQESIRKHINENPTTKNDGGNSR